MKKTEEQLKEINKMLKDDSITKEMKKSLENKKDVLLNNKTVKK